MSFFHKLFSSAIATSWMSGFVLLFNTVLILGYIGSSWSPEMNNIWFLFFAIISFSQLALFGFNTTFIRFISYSYSGIKIIDIPNLIHKKDEEFNENFSKRELSEILGLLKLIYIFISVGFFILSFLLGHFFIEKPLLALEDRTSGLLSWYIVLLSSTIVIFLNQKLVILNGIFEVPASQKIIASTNLVGAIFIIICIISSAKLLLMITVQQLILTFSYVLLACAASKKLKGIGIKNIRVNYSPYLFKIVFDAAWKMGISAINSALLRNLSAILVVQFFPTEKSVTFQFIKRFFDIVEQFSIISITARIPMLASLRSRGKIQEFTNLLLQTQNISYAVFFLGYVGIIFFAEFIVGLFDINVFFGDKILIITFSYACILNRWGGMMMITSNQANLVIAHVVAAILSLGYLIILISFLDNGNLAMAMIFGQILTVPYIARRTYATFSSNFLDFEIKQGIPYLVLLTIINVFYLYL